MFFGLCVLIDVSSLLTKGGDCREQERQLRKLIGLRDWMMAVLAFPIGAVSRTLTDAVISWSGGVSCQMPTNIH